jgi:hypothetical protein
VDSLLEYPQRDPLQSKWIRSPEGVMPYRSHVQGERPPRSKSVSFSSLREEPIDSGPSRSKLESLLSLRVVSEKPLVRSVTAAASKVSRIALVACIGIGWWGDDLGDGREWTFGIVVEAARASRREERENFSEEDLLEIDGTSKKFKKRPVVGSLTDG